MPHILNFEMVTYNRHISVKFNPIVTKVRAEAELTKLYH